MEIDAAPFYQMAERFDGAERRLDTAFIDAGNQAAKEGANIARSILASNGSIVTRGLYNSIQPRPVTRSGDVFTFAYGPTEEFPGRWVEKGRKPVVASPGSTLRFRIKGAGPYLYKRSVRAAAPRPFMRPSISRLRPIATKLFGQKVLETLNGVL